MDLRLALAILVGKVTQLILKIKGSGATAAPGSYALKIDPNLVGKLTKINNLKSIVVSGTNGKTTTTRLIFDILSTKYKVLHNRQGSNLLRGVASTLLSTSSLNGKISADLCLWEADEAALTQIVDQVTVKTLVLLNLFRDQLDRYGEIDTTRKKWRTVVSNLPKSSILILNSDDPSINYLAKFSKAKNFFFGVEANKINLPTVENVADVKYCINCGQNLVWEKIYSAHLGIYKCPNCNFSRHKPQIQATNLDFKKDFTTKINLTVNRSPREAGEPLTVNYSLPGLYNAYNVLAAISVAKTNAIDNKTLADKISSFSAAFGRYQSLKIHGISVLIFLVKNPAGANEIIRTIVTKNNIHLLAILNDKIADGRDVSWIWDTNWERLMQKTDNLFVSGLRAFDLALRFKYAHFKLDNNNIHEDINYSIRAALANLKTKDTLIILPTYTALLEVQKSLAKLGGVKWHEQ